MQDEIEELNKQIEVENAKERQKGSITKSNKL